MINLNNHHHYLHKHRHHNHHLCRHHYYYNQYFTTVIITLTGITTSIPIIAIAITVIGITTTSITIPIKRRKEMLYLTTQSTYFYFRLYVVGHMAKDHSDSERENVLPTLHELFFPISSNGSFICTIPQTG